MRQQYAEVVIQKKPESWHLIDFSQGLSDMAGCSKEELKNYCNGHFMKLLSTVDIPVAGEFFLCADKGKIICPWIFSLTCVGKDISLPVLLQIQEEDSQGLLHICIHDAAFLDERTEKMLGRIQSLEKSIPSGLCQVLLDDELTVIWHNNYLLESLGYTEEEFYSKLNGKAAGYIHPEDFTKVTELLEDAMKQGKKVIVTDMRIVTHDGTIRTLLTSLSFTGEMVNGFPVLYSMGIDITDGERTRQLELDTQRLKTAMDQVSSYVLEYDVSSHRIHASEVLERHFGLSKDVENVPESMIESGIIAAESADAARSIIEGIYRGEERSEGTVCMHSLVDGELWLHIRMTTVYDEEHQPVKTILLVENITERHKIEMRYLEEEKRRAAMTYDMDFQFQFNLTTGKILSVDKSRFPYFDFSSSDLGRELLRRKASVCIHTDDRAEYLKQLSIEAMLDLFGQGIPETRVEYRVKDGVDSYKWRRAVAHIIKEPVHGDACAYIYTKDIEKEKQLELELRRHAEQDILTGLYNRYTVELYCDQYIEQKKHDTLSAMYMLDLDNFKYLNDTYGHMRGDSMLRQVAECLQAIFKENALLGRIGGDELIVFQTECSSYEEAGKTAQVICDSMRQLEAGAGVVTMSVGVAFSPKDGSSFAELYHCADDALYQAKRSGKNGWAFFEKHEQQEDMIGRLPVSRDWLLEESSDIVYVSDFYSYDMLYMNQGARQLFGAEDNSYIGKKCYEVLQKKDQPCEFCTNHLLCREKFYSWEFCNKTLGKYLLLKDRIVDWYGVPARIEFATDISMIDKRTRDLEDKVEVDQAIISCLRVINSAKSFHMAAEPMLAKLAEFHGADRAFILVYNNQKKLLTPQYEWAKEDVRTVRELWGELGFNTDSQMETCFRDHKNYAFAQFTAMNESTSPYSQQLYDAGVFRQRSVPFYLNGQPAGFIGIDNPTRFQDDMTVMETLGYFVTEELAKSRLSDNLEYLSYHDSLTGLWNRNRYVEYMDEVRKGSLASMGLAVADLNALKDINKLRGHTQGDNVVRRAANLLKNSFPGAQIFRLSGDEFVVHSENVDRMSFLSHVKAAREGAPSLQGHGISIGYAWAGSDIDCSKLTAQATDIMVIEKQEYYRSQKESHTPGKHDYARLQSLLDALNKGYFEMYLQPKAGCADFELNGAEALVRYDSPETGLIYPDRFIPNLEQEHMIRYIDLFIFEEVCRLLARWKNEGRRLMTISLNFSRQTVLEPDLLGIMLKITDRYQVPKDCIEVEITESLGDYENSTIAEIGAGIKSAGFRLALDDFGSHYTNMDMLSTVPADVLKLDRSLIRNVMLGQANKLVLKSVLVLCKELGISSIAEGVETEEQLNLLRNLCCDSIQGYLFGRPVAVKEFERLYM